jgi:hypothetical protein
LKILTQLEHKFESFVRDFSIYSIKIFDENNNILEFRCSYKMPPSSLKFIEEGFDIEKKLIFPYKFSKKESLFI